MEDQGTPVVRKGSLLAEGTTTQHTEQPWPIFWSRHRNASLVSQSLGLVFANKELCLESVYGFRNYRGDQAACYWKLPPPVALTGRWTSIVSRWAPNDRVTNHSHWLLDALPRLALLREFPLDIKVIVPGKLAAYQKESLSMLGLTDDRIRFSPETHLQVEDYFFSSPTAMIACYSPYAIRFLRESFLPKADPAYQPPKRFFVRRTGLARNMDNEAEVERCFADQGWALINPSELTFAQEIRLFAEAEAVAGMLGSGLNNTIFSRSDCAVVAMAHDYWTDGVLDWILQTVGIQKYSVHTYPASPCRRFSVNLDILQQQLDSVGLHSSLIP
jgi:capsular polysaccharide biosynthesis protein